MKILHTIIALLMLLPFGAQASQPERALRRHLSAGNLLYAEKRYAEAEVEYKKALEANATSAAATFNLAASLIRQAGTGESGKKIMQTATELLTKATEMGNPQVAQKAAYNLGNIAYNAQQWDNAINQYKQALRLDPNDDRARQNLRMAQLKKRDQNQDQNKDQDKQDQQKDQQKEQDQQQQQQQQQPPKQDQQQQPQQPRQGSMSDDNAEKILKAMENEEARTRRRIQEQQNKEKANAARRTVTKPW